MLRVKLRRKTERRGNQAEEGIQVRLRRYKRVAGGSEGSFKKLLQVMLRMEGEVGRRRSLPTVLVQ